MEQRLVETPVQQNPKILVAMDLYTYNTVLNLLRSQERDRINKRESYRAKQIASGKVLRTTKEHDIQISFTPVGYC